MQPSALLDASIWIWGDVWTKEPGLPGNLTLFSMTRDPSNTSEAKGCSLNLAMAM